MLDYLCGWLALLLAALPSFLFLQTIDRQEKLTLLEKVSLSYGLGLGMIAWEMLVLQLGGIRFSFARIWMPLSVVSLALYGAVRLFGCVRRSKTPAEGFLQEKKISKQTLFFLWAILFELVHAFFRALIKPMESYDAVANWGLKAKVIYFAQSVPKSFLENNDYWPYHPDYPLLIPLVESYVYAFLGHLNDFVSKWIFPLYLTACVSLFYSMLRRISINRAGSLAFTFMLVSIPYFNVNATTGYADIVVAFYFSFGFTYLYLWIRGKQWIFLFLSALLTALAGMTKNEGLVLCLTNLVVLGISLVCEKKASKQSRRWVYPFVYASILVLLLAPWWIFRFSLTLTNDVLNRSSILAALRWENFQRIKLVLYHYQAQFFELRNWNLLWIMAFGVLVFRFKQILRSDLKYVALAILSVFSAYTAVYFITPYKVAPYDVLWHLRTSASRLFIHFVPLILFGMAKLYLDTTSGVTIVAEQRD
jgi:hypothetical protein